MKKTYEAPIVENKGRLEQLTARKKVNFSGFEIPTDIFEIE